MLATGTTHVPCTLGSVQTKKDNWVKMKAWEPRCSPLWRAPSSTEGRTCRDAFAPQAKKARPRVPTATRTAYSLSELSRQKTKLGEIGGLRPTSFSSFRLGLALTQLERKVASGSES